MKRYYYRSGMSKIVNRLRSAGKQEAVFIWIPKTAGTSIFQRLQQHGCLKAKSLDTIRQEFPQRGWVTFGHMFYPQLVANGYVSASFDERAFKFCFVRNPYERALSLFSYSKRIGKIDRSATFAQFVRKLADEGFEPVGLFHSRGMSQCNPQTAWTHDGRGRRIVDFVGRFERLDEDFSRLARRLGIEPKLSWMNRSDPGKGLAHYDDETRRIVGRLYEEGLDTYKYTFPAE